jgi:DNA adenine methylase
MSQLVCPLKVHGGKNAFNGKLARWIISLMPPHTHYVEPYAGGLAVLLHKNPEGTSEVVSDLNRDLMTFWRVLQNKDTFEDFRRIVEAVPFSEIEWDEATAALDRPDGDRVQRAVWFFVHCRQSLAGRMEEFASISKNRTRRGRNEQASAWQTAVAGLPLVHARLMRVAILDGPALDVIHSQGGPETTQYLDSPYLPETRGAPGVYGKYEMSEADHIELLSVLRSCKSKILLSGYPSELYDRNLPGWTRKTFPIPNNSAHGKRKELKTECVWCNF